MLFLILPGRFPFDFFQHFREMTLIEEACFDGCRHWRESLFQQGFGFLYALLSYIGPGGLPYFFTKQARKVVLAKVRLIGHPIQAEGLFEVLFDENHDATDAWG